MLLAGSITVKRNFKIRLDGISRNGGTAGVQLFDRHAVGGDTDRISSALRDDHLFISFLADPAGKTYVTRK
jgi:hypothetical protein